MYMSFRLQFSIVQIQYSIYIMLYKSADLHGVLKGIFQTTSMFLGKEKTVNSFYSRSRDPTYHSTCNSRVERENHPFRVSILRAYVQPEIFIDCLIRKVQIYGRNISAERYASIVVWTILKAKKTCFMV